MRTDPRDRAAAGVLSALTVLAVGAALIAGLGVRLTGKGEEAMTAFDVAPPPPPVRERVVPPPVRSARPEGRAAPPNIRSQATQVVAPPPVILLPVPPVFTVAPVAHIGSDPMAGAADRVGPGTGAGGEGDGFGGGGDGDGDGGGGVTETPPRRIRGDLRYGDFPDGTAELVGTRPVEVRYFVEPDGRPSGCRVTASSGIAAVDEITCRLIEKRFRYRPSRDAKGRPVRSVVTGSHDWDVMREPAAPVRR